MLPRRERSARAGVAAVGLALAAAASPSCAEPAAPGHVLVWIDTDAPVPSRRAGAPEPLFDAVRVEVLRDGEDAPCAECARELALDEETLRAGASFTVTGVTGARATVRVRMFRALDARATIAPERSVEVWARLPPFPAEGPAEATVFLPTSALGAPAGSRDTPIAPEPDHPPARVGSWPGAKRVPCAGSPRPDEACIPGGAFWMGHPLGSQPWLMVARQIATVSPFYLMTHEVSVAELRAHVAPDDPGITPWSGTYAGVTQRDWCTFTKAKGPNDDLPANCVTWAVARAYCQAIGADLPTEIQLEFAGSGRAGRLFVWGEDLPACGDAVWGRGGGGSFEEVARREGRCRPRGAGVSPREALGYPQPVSRADAGRDALALEGQPDVIDLAGNVREWSLDHFQDNTEPCWSALGPYVDPWCEPQSPRWGDQRTTRGGDFLGAQDELSASLRFGSFADVPEPSVGFRCARPAR